MKIDPKKMVDDVELSDNQTYLRNKRLPRADAEFEWTPQRIAELKKSKNDLGYFAQNYFFIVDVDEGKRKIDLYRSQRRVLKSLTSNRFVIVNASRQVGKALALDTPVPTPAGWTTMGQLKDNDVVFGSNGEPTRVVRAHDILYNRTCYEIEFSSGEKIIADEDHRWWAQSHYDRCHKRVGRIYTTKEFLNKLTVNQKYPQLNYSVPSAPAFEYPERDLLVDPYLLGYWLGDGFSRAPALSVSRFDVEEARRCLDIDPDIIREEITQPDGHYILWINQDKYKDGKRLITLLRELNVYRNKHIPEVYLRSSKAQRLELLKGLMDTDGSTVGKKCVFYNTNEQLADEALELVRSLGLHATKNVFLKNMNPKQTKIGKPMFRITFSSPFPVFKFKRKIDKQNCNVSIKQVNHYIKNITKIQSVPVRCITVDAEDELFTIGKTNIVSANTTLMTIYALWYTCFQSNKRVVIVANKEKTAIMILRRIKMAFEELPNWLKPGLATWGGTEVIFGNGSSIAISTTTGSAVRGDSVNCITGDNIVTVRNKKTGKIEDIEMSELFNRVKINNRLDIKLDEK